jgi:hypothetical protein
MIDSNDCRPDRCTALRLWGLALAAAVILCEIVVLLAE